jgi:hypothetical protein
MTSSMKGGFQRDDASGALLVAGYGVELGYAEITSNPNPGITSVAPAWQDIPGLVVPVVVGNRPIVVIFSGPRVFNSGAFRTDIGIREGVNDLQVGQLTSNAANDGSPMVLRVRLAPTPGAHTYKISGRVSAASTGTIQAAATGPASIQVLEC